MNAEFVGRTAGRQFDRLAFHAVNFDLDPPERGAEWPSGWVGSGRGRVRDRDRTTG